MSINWAQEGTIVSKNISWKIKAISKSSIDLELGIESPLEISSSETLSIKFLSEFSQILNINPSEDTDRILSEMESNEIILSNQTS